MSTWQLKSDEDVLAAATRLFDYTNESEAQIRAELARRGLPEPPPPVGQCSTCGRSIAHNHPAGDCLQCGAPLDSAVQQAIAGKAAPLSEHPRAVGMNTTRLGGWLLLLVVGLTVSLATGLASLAQAYSALPEVVANGYGGFIGLAIAVDAALVIFTSIALVRLTGLRRNAPKLTMILLAVRPVAAALVALVALASEAGAVAQEIGFDIFRAALYAAIWMPYIHTSVRVKLTFVR